MTAMTKPLPFIVVDTCILLSNVLRYLSFAVASHGYFYPVWSPCIRAEWLRNAARLWQLPAAQLATDWEQWEQQYPLANQSQYFAYTQGLQYSDPKDWHVIAAARAAQASTGGPVGILTKNIKDFNRSELRRLHIQRYSPDVFFHEWALQQPNLAKTVLEGVVQTTQTAQGPVYSLSELLKRERLFNLNTYYRSL